jgi:hypothetical protein
LACRNSCADVVDNISTLCGAEIYVTPVAGRA